MRIALLVLAIYGILITSTSVFIREPFSVVAITLLFGLLIFLAAMFILNKRSRLTFTTSVTLLCGIFALATIGIKNLPLKIAFSFLENRFDAVSTQILAGNKERFPTWIGPFHIVSAGIRDGSEAPYLMTSGHTGEINAFVMDQEGRYFNLWSIVPLGDKWAYVEED